MNAGMASVLFPSGERTMSGDGLGVEQTHAKWVRVGVRGLTYGEGQRWQPKNDVAKRLRPHILVSNCLQHCCVFSHLFTFGTAPASSLRSVISESAAHTIARTAGLKGLMRRHI